MYVVFTKLVATFIDYGTLGTPRAGLLYALRIDPILRNMDS